MIILSEILFVLEFKVPDYIFKRSLYESREKCMFKLYDTIGHIERTKINYSILLKNNQNLIYFLKYVLKIFLYVYILN